eukprot:scaffold148552_cov27-Tisochrysis_lutea.AAC.4
MECISSGRIPCKAGVPGGVPGTELTGLVAFAEPAGLLAAPAPVLTPTPDPAQDPFQASVPALALALALAVASPSPPSPPPPSLLAGAKGMLLSETVSAAWMDCVTGIPMSEAAAAAASSSRAEGGEAAAVCGVPLSERL